MSNAKLPDARVLRAELVPALPATSATLPGLASAPATAPYCKVQAVATPTKDSEIGLEIWMPTEEWNGELLQIGNGGLAGSINETSMAQGVARHFAVAATDDGHKGAGTDGLWAIGHPEKVIDFGYRAVHITSVLSRLLVQDFYGRPQSYAFFNGCSEGGREALMEAQRYPGDFNGILAGSPAADWTGLMIGFAWNAQAVLADPRSYLKQEQRELVERAVIKACGTQGGVSDPFAKDPLSCKFDPRILLCKGAASADCLTGPQLTTLLKVYSGASEPASHRQLYPGYEPGPEAESGTPSISYASYIYGTDRAATLNLVFSSAFYGGAVANTPDYSSMAFNFSKDVATMKKKVGPALDATATDLRAFKAQGGKLLEYHGWYDGSPAPRASINYYNAVTHTMSGFAETQTFYKLYMAPGMMHCGQGPGPNSFGNLLDSSDVLDPEHNIFSALRAWVEHGRVPELVVATKYPADDTTKPPVMTRPLCAFPKVARYTGHGSAADAANFTCAATLD